MDHIGIFRRLVATLAGFCIGCSSGPAATPKRLDAVGQGATPRRVPVIYGTDLLHPHSDPDDHFDLATVFAMPELDVQAILLDRGAAQKERPGRTPVEQMFRLTGRRVPYATGLSSKLKSPADEGLDQPQEDQAAVELLLKTLRGSPEPMVLFFTGSVRDVCAAFNREPALLRKKVSRLYINMGSLLVDQGEWNEQLDPQAYIGLMRSGLPIYWCPCRPKGNLGTHWQFKHGEILEGVPPVLLNWFIYALQTSRLSELDPMKALTMDLRPWRHLVMRMERHMWCTGPLIHAAGRSIYRVGDHWVASASAPAGGRPQPVFTFVPVRVEITDVKGRAYTKWSEYTSDANMQVYKVTEPMYYEPAMKSCLRDLLHHFPAVLKAEYE
jgi:hypothetical protein